MPSVPAKYQAVADVTVEGDTTVVDIISSWPVYAALANQNAQLAVGEELFTLIHDGIIIIPLSDMEEYGSKPNSHPAAVEHSFNTQTIATTVSKREIGGCDNWWGPRRKGKRRVRGKLKMSTNLIGTVRTRARTQCDRMNWFRTYFPERADRIEVNATLEFDSGGGENVIAIDNDVTHVEETFTNTGCITAFFGGGIHEATDFGDTRSCFSQPQFTCP